MPEEPEEESFTFRDRRRSQIEEPAPTPVAAAPEVAEIEILEEATLEEGTMPGEEGEYPSELPDVWSVLMLFMGELRNLSWLRMGLVANPMTNEIEKDLDQAKVAIDTIAFLATQIEPVISPEERLPLKAMVSDLRMNFVEQSKRP